MPEKIYKKKCEKCGKPFKTSESATRFCSHSCEFYFSRRIKDEFTGMVSKRTGKPVSRQYIHMMRKNKAGICRLCNKPLVSGGFCLEHLVKKREQARVRVQATGRNDSLSYRLEQKQEKKKRRKIG